MATNPTVPRQPCAGLDRRAFRGVVAVMFARAMIAVVAAGRDVEQ